MWDVEETGLKDAKVATLEKMVMIPEATLLVQQDHSPRGSRPRKLYRQRGERANQRYVVWQ